MENEEIKGAKTDRVIELFFRALKGESLSAQKLADEYRVSTRSISRDINNLKNFLAEHSELLGYPELVYSNTDHCYNLSMDNLLTNKELFSITKVLIGSRAFKKNEELLKLIEKLKKNTTLADRQKLENLYAKNFFTIMKSTLTVRVL